MLNFVSEQAIIQYQNQHRVKSAFKEFHQYFNQFWMTRVTPQEFCVGNLRNRTNNFVEGYNSKIKTRIVRNPNIYRFLSEIQKLVSEDYNKMLFEMNPRNNYQRKDKSKLTSKIQRANRWLHTGRINEKQFLLYLSETFVNRIA